MYKRYAWRRGWKQQYRSRPQYNRPILTTLILIGVVGLVLFGAALLLAVFRLPVPLPDLRRVGLIALVVIGIFDAIIYWTIIGIATWRWYRAQDRRGKVSPDALNAAFPVTANPPRVNTNPARSGRRVPSISLSPSEFEQEVAWVFGKLSNLQTEVVGKSNDGGIDVKAYDATGTLAAIIQAKRYDEQKALNPGFLRELDSCKRRMGVARAYLVTTAHFSPEVRQQAEEMHIDLVDGQLFEEWRQNAYALSRNGR